MEEVWYVIIKCVYTVCVYMLETTSILFGHHIHVVLVDCVDAVVAHLPRFLQDVLTVCHQLLSDVCFLFFGIFNQSSIRKEQISVREDTKR